MVFCQALGSLRSHSPTLLGTGEVWLCCWVGLGWQRPGGEQSPGQQAGSDCGSRVSCRTPRGILPCCSGAEPCRLLYGGVSRGGVWHPAPGGAAGKFILIWRCRGNCCAFGAGAQQPASPHGPWGSAGGPAGPAAAPDAAERPLG